MAKKKQDTPMSAEAISALRQSSYKENSFALPEENLACYGEIKALVECLGGKWVKGKRRLVFGDGVNAQALVFAACDRGSIPASNPNDFFPTPDALVKRLTEADDFASQWAAKITCAQMDSTGIRYLEPSGGAGALAEAIAERMRPQDSLTIVELNPLLADGLRKRFPQATVIEADFLAYDSEEPFDVVLMNPPFNGSRYARHVRHAFSMLSNMGILAAIVPSSFTMHGDDFLYMVAEAGYWSDFGAEHFEGTDVATSGLWVTNDPERNWRERPHEGYQTQHAWNIAVSLTSDSEWIAEVNDSDSFEDFQRILEGHVSEQLKAGCAERVDAAIALDVLQSLVSDYGADYGFDALAKFLPEVPAQAAARRRGAEAAVPATVFAVGQMEQMDLLGAA